MDSIDILFAVLLLLASLSVHVGSYFWEESPLLTSRRNCGVIAVTMLALAIAAVTFYWVRIFGLSLSPRVSTFFLIACFMPSFQAVRFAWKTLAPRESTERNDTIIVRKR